ncbi:hypothetical protein BRADI_4g11114v3 [Brachypodium distachyon]|uniref:Uncharacterized protein n=1 Tax=Brachypodium distachyon TaxID=15368 RepID=A0A2K2CM18_BRADI|nr:hypothetical protein BRADI_4g11114v3 [Brachypodium distachyon]
MGKGLLGFQNFSLATGRLSTTTTSFLPRQSSPWGTLGFARNRVG